jgi:deazaflavin-dependent oxidoreductase (nitroreductase family)
MQQTVARLHRSLAWLAALHLVNALAMMGVTALLRRGVKMNTNTLLTVPGRKSGRPRMTPVTIIEQDGGRYVSSPFGEVDWVRNLSAAGRPTLSRDSHSDEIVAIALTPEEAAPILRHALTIGPGVIRACLDVTVSSPIEEIVAEAPRHPTFELIGAPRPRQHHLPRHPLRAAPLSRHPPLTGQVQRATVRGAVVIYDVALI